MTKFAKLFETKELGQVLFQKVYEGSDRNPELSIAFVDPSQEGINQTVLVLGFYPNKEGEAERDRIFTEISDEDIVPLIKTIKAEKLKRQHMRNARPTTLTDN